MRLYTVTFSVDTDADTIPYWCHAKTRQHAVSLAHDHIRAWFEPVKPIKLQAVRRLKIRKMSHVL